MAAFAYLDHNATSPLRAAAFESMVEVLRAGGNPSSVHAAGRKARAAGEHQDRAFWIAQIKAACCINTGISGLDVTILFPSPICITNFR